MKKLVWATAGLMLSLTALRANIDLSMRTLETSQGSVKYMRSARRAGKLYAW